MSAGADSITAILRPLSAALAGVNNFVSTACAEQRPRGPPAAPRSCQGPARLRRASRQKRRYGRARHRKACGWAPLTWLYLQVSTCTDLMAMGDSGPLLSGVREALS